MHVGHVFVDHGGSELCLVVVDTHENDAILLIVCSASLFSESVCPLGRLVAPVTVVAVITMRVSQLDKLVTGRELKNANHCVGVSKDDAFSA